MIIALCGSAGSGKSTAAAYLAERHGFTRTRFAGPLKAMLRVLGLGDAELEGGLKEVPSPLLCGRTPRHAMQTLGTEFGRQCIHPDFWVDLWSRNALKIRDEGGSVVVEDCRFPNEVQAVRELGGAVICIKGRGGISGAHASEIIPPHDMSVWNDGPVRVLHHRLDGLLERLSAKGIMAAE